MKNNVFEIKKDNKVSIVMDTSQDGVMSINKYDCWQNWNNTKMLPSYVKLWMPNGSILRGEGMVVIPHIPGMGQILPYLRCLRSSFTQFMYFIKTIKKLRDKKIYVKMNNQQLIIVIHEYWSYRKEFKSDHSDLIREGENH